MLSGLIHAVLICHHVRVLNITEHLQYPNLIIKVSISLNSIYVQLYFDQNSTDDCFQSIYYTDLKCQVS
jgi:hypothetical protein